MFYFILCSVLLTALSLLCVFISNVERMSSQKNE